MHVLQDVSATQLANKDPSCSWPRSRHSFVGSKKGCQGRIIVFLSRFIQPQLTLVSILIQKTAEIGRQVLIQSEFLHFQSDTLKIDKWG